MTKEEKINKYTYTEYIALEQEINEKHDFYFGEVFNMAGGTIRHNVMSLE